MTEEVNGVVAVCLGRVLERPDQTRLMEPANTHVSSLFSVLTLFNRFLIRRGLVIG